MRGLATELDTLSACHLRRENGSRCLPEVAHLTDDVLMLAP